MKVNLLYKGLFSAMIFREEIDVIDEHALNELKRVFEASYPTVSELTNDVDIFRFLNGKNPSVSVFKWKLFDTGNISEMAHLIALEVM